MMHAVVVLAVSLSAAEPEEPAPPDYQYRVEATELWVTAPNGRSYRTEVPCTGSVLAVHRERLYVACGEEGLAVYSLAVPSTPELVAERDLGGDVVGFHESGGELWAEVLRRDARLVSQATASLPPAGPRGEEAPHRPPAPEPPQPAPVSPRTEGTPAPADPQPFAPPRMVAQGEVVELRGSRVVVTLGREQGLASGDRVQLFEVREVSLGDGRSAAREEVVAVGEVSTVAGDRAEVELGRNETVPLGTSARRTTAPVTASRWVPPRPAGAWHVSFTVRPFLALGDLGAGTVSDAAIGVRLEPDIHVLALFEPVGIGLAREGNIFAGAGNLFVGYDTRFFEVALGAGWSVINEADSGVDTDGDGIFDRLRDSAGSGFSLAQLARLGSEDGIHLTARNTFLLYDDEFHYGGTVGEVLFPVSDRAGIFGRGGGGESGFGFGELGLRLLLRGNGGPDSVFVSASLGGAELSSQESVTCASFDPGTGQPVTPVGCTKDVEYAGPMVGFGIEWRP